MAYGRLGSEPMSGVAIFMEGGGERAGTRQFLRMGMTAFLSQIRDDCRDKEMALEIGCLRRS